MPMTELEKIAQRIAQRNAAQATDRARQRELIRQRVRVDGRTWDEVQAEAKVSRPTIRDALRSDD